MKHFYILVIALFFAGGIVSVSAQDLIILKNGTVVEARVVEISTTEIRYRRFSHLDGPVIVVPVDSVLSIRYENGITEIINEAATGGVAGAEESVPQRAQSLYPSTLTGTATSTQTWGGTSSENTKPVLFSVGARVDPHLYYRSYDGGNYYLNGYLPLYVGFEAEFLSWILFSTTLRYNTGHNFLASPDVQTYNNYMLTFLLQGKHEFILNQRLTLYPLAELRYRMWLYEQNNKTGYEWTRDDLKDDDLLNLYIGGGMEYGISERWMLNAELTYYFWLYEKWTLENYENYSYHGPDIMLGLDYGINEYLKLNTELNCSIRYVDSKRPGYYALSYTSYFPGLRLGLEYDYDFNEHLKLEMKLSYPIDFRIDDDDDGYMYTTHTPSLSAGIKYTF